MAVISVEVPDKIAMKFTAYTVISSYSLYNELEANKDSLILNFWEKWMGKKEFEKYLSVKDSI